VWQYLADAKRAAEDAARDAAAAAHAGVSGVVIGSLDLRAMAVFDA
jgi:hypothetical protein